MRVAVVEPAGKGGLIHYAYQLCSALAARGADVTLVTDRNYELRHLPHTFRVDEILELWDPKPSVPPPASEDTAPAAGLNEPSVPAVAVILNQEGREGVSEGSAIGNGQRTAQDDARGSPPPAGSIRRAIRRGVRAIRYYREWLRIAAHLRRLRPDVVQLGDIRFPFDLIPLLIVRRSSRLLADICHNVRPFAASGRARGLFHRSRVSAIFYRRIYALFDLVFVHFERNRDEFLATFPLDPDSVEVIVHGNEGIFAKLRDPGVDARVLRARLGLRTEDRVVLFFGTLSRYKGTDILLEAFPSIHRRTGAKLVFAGFPFTDFDLDAEKERARQLGVDHAVIWLPDYIPSSEIVAWMELASVVVFPYRAIYQSGALHVPHTFGVPIVASAAGAMTDVIVDGQTGLLVEPENPDALATAVIRVLEDDELAARLGSRASADAEDRFGWDRVAGILFSRYERELAPR
ncbi:MAG TPA: glycosyltransferase family 4 protein [Thermoanaerobaculia bacterium]|nr:glycosyltransferase family 4 protein [Thermoanaerobaculia bacterium]